MNSKLNRPLGFWLGLLAANASFWIMVYLTIYVFRRIPHDHLGDFPHYFTASLAMLRGDDIYQVITPQWDRPKYLYPPLVAFLYSPLAQFFSEITAARIALLMNVTAICTGLYLGARAMLERFGEDLKAPGAWKAIAIVIFGALILSLDKTKGELQMLQTNAMIFAALAAAIWLLDRSPFAAGAALGFAMNIKYQAIAILPYLLLRRRWKAAASMLLWTIIFGYLPALLVGFGTDTRYLVKAFGGILRLVGISGGAAGDVADIEEITAGFSVSITSGVARAIRYINSSASPMVIAAIIGVIWLGVLSLIYVRRRAPILRWPAAGEQASQPWRDRVALEWIILIGTTLCFSPQTNARHMVLTTLINLCGMAILVARRRISWPVIIALALIWAGLNLPPGHRDEITGLQPHSLRFWHDISGPSWLMLIAIALIAWSALNANAAKPDPDAHPRHLTTNDLTT